MDDITDVYNDTELTDLPRLRTDTEAAMAMKHAPVAMHTALTFVAPLRPQRSMMRFATRLPQRPPIVKIAVTAEKVKSDMGMQVGRPWRRGCGGCVLQVRTACIWLSTEIW